MNGAWKFGVGALAMPLVLGTSARGANQVVIDEVLGGCGDSPAAQFVEIAFVQGYNRWAGCARLEFRDATGALVGTMEFPSNPPDPLPVNSALVATAEFARLPGAPRPDFVMPALVATPSGEVCFRGTGGPGCAPVEQCVAYGDTPTNLERAPALSPDGAASLQRIGSIGCDQGFGLPPPAPRNADGNTAALRCTSAALIERGEHLFFEETFDGNGRTCGTCHPAAHEFTIGPSVVATLQPCDPLFVAEGPPELAGLERTPLLRGPRTLVLENVDGFDRPPVFRGTPHLLNVGRTAPYGLAGDVPDLQTFSAMAVRQHFPRSLARVPGVDFREPTADELAALEAFMQTIFAGDPEGVDPWRLVLRPAAVRGRERFFGEARCFFCHNDPFLSSPGTFDTGVTRQPINLVPPPECEDCPAIGPLENGRAFDVPSLLGVRDTAPFFHDNSAATLHDAVAFYGSRSFTESPAGQIFGPIALRPEDVDDLTAFLDALTACGNGVVDRGEACDDGNLADGDCCAADCGTATADGLACDDGDACTTATECRRGACVVRDAEPCGGRTCTESDTLTPAVITCAVASVMDDAPRCRPHADRLWRKLDRAVRLVGTALSGSPSPHGRRSLRRAATMFRRAARLAGHQPPPACEAEVAAAALEAQRRTLCVLDCTGGRDPGSDAGRGGEPRGCIVP